MTANPLAAANHPTAPDVDDALDFLDPDGDGHIQRESVRQALRYYGGTVLAEVARLTGLAAGTQEPERVRIAVGWSSWDCTDGCNTQVYTHNGRHPRSNSVTALSLDGLRALHTKIGKFLVEEAAPRVGAFGRWVEEAGTRDVVDWLADPANLPSCDTDDDWRVHDAADQVTQFQPLDDELLALVRRRIAESRAGAS